MAAQGVEGQEGGRGRSADRPRDIPARGWRDIAFRVKDELAQDNISILAAGVAFYALLALFPALAALVSIYGLMAEPADVERQIQSVSGVLPAEARGIIQQQLHQVASSAPTSLGLGAIFGILVALWSATAGVKTLFAALNVTYDEEEKRGFIKFNAMALAVTAGAILFAVLAIAFVVIAPAVLNIVGLGGTLDTVLRLLRWPLLALAVILFLAVLYRFGPSREGARWRWVSWGAVAATVLWLIGSMLFSWYVSSFASYNETYGSLGAVVILMMWFYISAYIVLLGAEVNAEMEHQTARDTTTGAERPIGQRGAQMADTVGERR